MKTSARELRRNLDRVIDTVLKPGEPVEIARKAGIVRTATMVSHQPLLTRNRLIRDDYRAAFWDNP